MTPALAAAAPCPVCDRPLFRFRHDWQLRCGGCGFLASTLGEGEPSALDEVARAEGLSALRRRNFEVVLDRMAGAGACSPARLLDVGCAHGWFLDAASARGFSVTGIEPDAAVAAEAVGRGHDIRTGLFPEALAAGELFDAITFHDVFEHLPDPAAALAASAAHLGPEGFLVLNLPSRAGAFFRAALALDAIGRPGPLERLWQKGFPSPHRSYFDPGTLARLAVRHGFVELSRSTLPTLERRGLAGRIRYDRTASWLASAAALAAVTAGLPLLPLLPADIVLLIFQRE